MQTNTAQGNSAHDKITQMSDIFVTLPVVELSPLWQQLIIIAAGLLGVIVIFFIYKKLTTPLAQLERHLKQGRLSPRQAAHGLAHIIPDNVSISSSLQRQIEHIRFQRQVPDINKLLDLINKVKHEF